MELNSHDHLTQKMSFTFSGDVVAELMNQISRTFDMKGEDVTTLLVPSK